jgi:hypothetical protein
VLGGKIKHSIVRAKFHGKGKNSVPEKPGLERSMLATTESLPAHVPLESLAPMISYVRYGGHWDIGYIV